MPTNREREQVKAGDVICFKVGETRPVIYGEQYLCDNTVMQWEVGQPSMESYPILTRIPQPSGVELLTEEMVEAVRVLLRAWDNGEGAYNFIEPLRSAFASVLTPPPVASKGRTLKELMQMRYGDRTPDNYSMRDAVMDLADAIDAINERGKG